MQILGIRSAPKEIRYAILEFNGDEIRFVNMDDENKLSFPSEFKNPEDKINWLYDELNRILNSYSKIERIAIKEPEFKRICSNRADREIEYLNGTILLIAAQKRKCVNIKLYNSIGTNSSQVKEFAEEKIGRTKKNWNAQMADAVSVAWSESENLS